MAVANGTGSKAGSKRVLVVEDDSDVADFLADVLHREGFVVSLAADGERALELSREDNHDVVLLDFELPGISGQRTCQELRTFCDSYIVMLTGRDSEIDKVVCLSVGADDYITKPFSQRELVARLNALLRRPRTIAPQQGVRIIGDLAIDPIGRVVRVGAMVVGLTRIEFDILDQLSERPSEVVTRNELLERVWPSSLENDDHLIDAHISNLRRKIAECGLPPGCISTVRGIGYRFMSSGIERPPVC